MSGTATGDRSGAAASTAAGRPAPAPRALLLDCDGVLQHGIAGALDELADRVGAALLPALFAEEEAALRGREPLREALSRVLAVHAPGLAVDEVITIWDRYELDPAALELVARSRALGVPVHLATNQQDYRRDSMQQRYAGLVDGAFYSCEIGWAKPDPEFYAAMVDRLGLPAGELLFVDDLLPNVQAARRAGLRAEHHDPAAGAEHLADLLRRNGIDV